MLTVVHSSATVTQQTCQENTIAPAVTPPPKDTSELHILRCELSLEGYTKGEDSSETSTGENNASTDRAEDSGESPLALAYTGLPPTLTLTTPTKSVTLSLPSPSPTLAHALSLADAHTRLARLTRRAAQRAPSHAPGRLSKRRKGKTPPGELARQRALRQLRAQTRDTRVAVSLHAATLRIDIVLHARLGAFNKFAPGTVALLRCLTGCAPATATATAETNTPPASTFVEHEFNALAVRLGRECAAATPPIAADVPGLRVPLLPFQRESVAWMLRKERGDASYPNTLAALNHGLCHGYVELALPDATVYWNQYTQYVMVQEEAAGYTKTPRPPQARGLLCEEMGLGKTVEVLALALLSPPPRGEAQHANTLVICPRALLQQWAREAAAHTDPPLRVCHYRGYGANGARSPHAVAAELRGYDIVLTTYNVINAEVHYAQFSATAHKRARRGASAQGGGGGAPLYDYSSPLALCHWHRVVLDEVQMLRSDNTQAARCTALLPRTHTWGVSGTPVQHIRDMQTVLAYLRVEPFAALPELVGGVARGGSPLTLPALYSVFRSAQLCMRHAKRDVAAQIHVPPQTHYLVPLEFYPVEWDNYLAVWDAFLRAAHYTPGGTVAQGHAPPLPQLLNQWLLRLRYTCCHAVVPVASAPTARDTSLQQDGSIDEVLQTMTTKAEQTRRGLYRDAMALRIRSAQAEMELLENTQGAIAQFQAVAGELQAGEEHGHHSELLHQCYFFLGTAYYFLGSRREEHGEAVPGLARLQEQERGYYARAEALRAEMLADRARLVAAAVQAGRGNEDSPPALSLSPVRFADDVPDMAASFHTRRVHAALGQMFAQLDAQAEQFNGWAAQLVLLLSKPVGESASGEGESDEGESTDAYSGSLDDQDRAFAYMHCLEELLRNRDAVVSSDDDEIALGGSASVALDPEYSPFHRQLIADLRLVTQGTGLRASFTALRNARVVHGRSSSATASFEDHLLAYEPQAGRMRKEITRLREALRQRWSPVYNARVAYFAQLQHISDALVSLVQLEPAQQRAAEREARTNGRLADTRRRLAQAESRLKYLAGLARLQAAELQAEEGKSQAGDGVGGAGFTCAICLGRIHRGAIVKCGHIFCAACIGAWLKQHHTCPMCKQETSVREMHTFRFGKEPLGESVAESTMETVKEEKTLESKQLHDKELVEVPSHISALLDKYAAFSAIDQVHQIKIKRSFGAKIDFVVKLILYLRLRAEDSNDAPPQILLYSQNIEFLKVITRVLTLNGISHLEGFQNNKRISDTIDRFKTDPKITCLLLNVRTLGAGLNLLNARHIFLLDPIINHGDELQATSRNNRIGQTRETFVWNFMIRDSVEENIMLYKHSLESEGAGEHEEEDEDDVEINAESTEMVADKHLWHCFFREESEESEATVVQE